MLTTNKPVSALLLICLCLSFTTKAQTDTTRVYRVGVYAEAFGHNYYAWGRKISGVFSLNFCYRSRIRHSDFYGMLSAGWGFFSENSPGNRTIHYFPLEAALQYGRKNSLVEIGLGAALGTGQQTLSFNEFHGGYTEKMVASGTEFIGRIGYAYFYKAFFFRLSVVLRTMPPIDIPPGTYIYNSRFSFPLGASVGFFL